MGKKQIIPLPVLLVTCVLITSGAWAQNDFQKKYQSACILAESGTVIELPEGHFTLSNTLSIDGKQHVTLRGKGMDKTFLSFKGQLQGSEGIRVSGGADITLEGFTVQDAKGDGVKTQHVDGITFRDIKTEWTGDPGPDNGGYGLYPVQCSRVRIENCAATGASDAGIYVGQSQDIIVTGSKAWHNVAGIEIENSLRAEVLNNEAYENTGGLLVFDLPDLIQKKGGDIRVHDNLVRDNNFPNFAPKGNIVATVPAGTGMLIMAVKNVEVYNNQFRNNQSTGTGIISYLTTGRPIKDSQYDPFASAISIHDNQYERKPGPPASTDPISTVVAKTFGADIPQILYDGIRDPKLLDKDGQWKQGYCISIMNNQPQTIVNLDVANQFRNMQRADHSFNCKLQQP